MALVGSSSVFTCTHTHRVLTSRHTTPSVHYLSEDIDQIVVEVWVLVQGLQFLKIHSKHSRTYARTYSATASRVSVPAESWCRDSDSPSEGA